MNRTNSSLIGLMNVVAKNEKGIYLCKPFDLDVEVVETGENMTKSSSNKSKNRKNNWPHSSAE